MCFVLLGPGLIDIAQSTLLFVFHLHYSLFFTFATTAPLTSSQLSNDHRINLPFFVYSENYHLLFASRTYKLSFYPSPFFLLPPVYSISPTVPLVNSSNILTFMINPSLFPLLPCSQIPMHRIYLQTCTNMIGVQVVLWLFSSVDGDITSEAEKGHLLMQRCH